MEEEGIVIILLGPPGAGKGTQARLLSKKFNLVHIATGDILREAVKEGTSLGRAAKNYIDKGALVPDELIIGLIKEKLENNKKNRILFDGFPRTINQAIALEELLDKLGIKLLRMVVLYIKISDEVIIERLTKRLVCSSCGMNYHRVFNPPKEEYTCDVCRGVLFQRQDDKEEVVRKRLEVYHNQTSSLIEFYKEKKILNEVSGEGSIDEIFRRISNLTKLTS